MRFEIWKGGAFLIVVALIGLSGAVFALGLVAGYQMARQNQPDVNQTSTTYPLPAAPAEESKEEPGAETSPAAEMSPAETAPVKPAPPPPVAAVQPVPRVSPASRVSPATVARVRPLAPAPAPSTADEEEADSEPALLAPPSLRHPYNLQIQPATTK